MRTWGGDAGFGGGGGFSVPQVTPVVRKLLWVNIALGVFFLLFGAHPSVARVYTWFSLDVPRWRESAPWFPLWQLFTYGFLHSTLNPMHLLGNMLGLYMFGSWLESLIGSRRFTFFYCAGIVVPAIAQLIASLLLGQSLVVVGASGAIVFLVIAMATLQPQAQVIFLIFPMRLWVLATGFVLLDAFWLVKGGTDSAHLVHLVGAAFGFAAAKWGWLWMDVFAVVEARREEKRVEREASDEERLDELLQRIHKDGIGSLSAREREFLKRMSSRRGG